MRSRLWDLPAEIIDMITRLLHSQRRLTWGGGNDGPFGNIQMRPWSGARRRYSDGTFAFKPYTDRRLYLRRWLRSKLGPQIEWYGPPAPSVGEGLFG